MIKLDLKEDYVIKLDGKKIPSVTSVNVKVETPKDSLGLQTEPTYAAEIEIKRKASEPDMAIIDLFELATGGPLGRDGRKYIFKSGNLEFSTDDGQKKYMFEIKKAFIAEWSITNPADPSAPTEETVTIRAGSIAFAADGGNVDFTLKNFELNA